MTQKVRPEAKVRPPWCDRADYRALGAGRVRTGDAMRGNEVRYDINRTVSRDDVLELYDSVGWSAYTEDPDSLIRGLENSAIVVTACSAGKLVGLARAISDWAAIAYLQDVLVHPAHRCRGIATALVSRALEAFARVRQHVLLTDAGPGQRAFYESLGFTEIRDLLGPGDRSFVGFNL